jgi:membrane protein DedA with SNARE-associated domain/membrane-associated phospholipid phosphatase
MLIDQLKPFIDWLHIHPYWAGFFVFLISFGESIAIFGLLVPGSVVMTAIGALMGAGVLPLYPMMAWAIAGAILGDIFSFWVGSHFHQRVRNIWPFTRYPQVLLKGEEFFERHGGKSVFLGRFVGPIRPVIPLVAGMLNMKPSRFFMADIPAAIAWAPAYMLPGILLGQLSLQLQPEIASQFLLAIFALLILVWLIYWLLKRMALACINRIRVTADKIWLRFARYKRSLSFMQVPGNPHDSTQFRLFLSLMFLVLLLGVLTYYVTTKGWLTDWDRPVFHFMYSLQSLTVTRIMNLITFLGANKVLAAMSVAVFCYLLWKRYFWALFHWTLLNFFCYAGIELMKDWVQVPRPGSLSSMQYGWSFPSGHTTYTVAVFGFLAVLTTQNASLLFKRCCYSMVALLVAVIGVSRLYLGFHWLSDILGGILLGLIVVSAVTFSYRHRKSEAVDPVSLWIVALLSLFLAWSAYSLHFFRSASEASLSYWPSQVIDDKAWWDQSGSEPPLYRTNRFGKPVQLINIQWVGDVRQIQHTLLKRGWKLPAKPDLGMLVSILTNKNSSDLNPVFLTKYYRDRKPVLVMTKLVHHPQYPGQYRLTILRLWDSHIFLRQTNQVILVGTVNYYRPWKPVFLPGKGTENRLPTMPAIDEFNNDLSDFRSKKLFYHRAQSTIGENIDWTGYVLLIKSE